MVKEIPKIVIFSHGQFCVYESETYFILKDFSIEERLRMFLHENRRNEMLLPTDFTTILEREGCITKLVEDSRFHISDNMYFSKQEREGNLKCKLRQLR